MDFERHATLLFCAKSANVQGTWRGGSRKALMSGNDMRMADKVEQISQEQELLFKEIKKLAINKGYDSESLEPIADGVVDVSSYVKSKRRLMWVLKEAYDCFDENNMPWGGGWRFFSEEQSCAPSVVNGSPTFRKIAYTSGILADDAFDRYESMPWLSETPELCKVLRRIAYINTGKMPGGLRTSGDRLLACYSEWRDVLWKQIKLYDPDVLIFAGTLDVYAKDMGIDLSRSLKTYSYEGTSYVDVYSWNGKGVFYAYHPASFTNQEKYVDLLVDAVRDFEKENGSMKKGE